MAQLQKVIISIGMFSLLEFNSQDRFGGNGFDELKKILSEKNPVLLKRPSNAINELKHGKGRSYDKLVGESESLPFKIILAGKYFFHEGDVSEIVTLIKIDDEFVLNCAKLIKEVHQEI